MIDRAAMIERMRRHGWTADLAFGCCGPVLFIRGVHIPGFIEMPVPVRLDDDHTKSLDGVYNLVGHAMASQGRYGEC